MQRALLPALLLLGLQLPAFSQTPDPWAGISIVVTPPTPDDGPAAEAEAGDQAAPDTAAAEEPPAPEPSLWTALDLGLGDVDAVPPPEPTPAEVIARQTRKPQQAVPAAPTSVDLKEGPARFALSTGVTTAAPVSSALSTSAGGGSGEVKGRVDYALDNLVVYGVGGLGAAESTGALSVYDSLAFGSTYKVPLAPLGLGKDDSLDARVEVANSQEVKTSVELRSALGPYQRFIAVERDAALDTDGSNVVRAGILGKF